MEPLPSVEGQGAAPILNATFPIIWSEAVAGTVDGSRGSPRRRQLPEEVAAYVRDLITSGQVRPSEFLRIEPIAEALGVSQTPVREGLLSLRSEGLVELLPRRGFVVAPFTPQDISDLYWAQAQLSGELAYRAAQNISDDQLNGLAANIEEYAAAVAAGDWELIPDIGLDFHRLLNSAAHSNRLVLLFDTTMASLPNRYYAAGNPKHTSREHPQILKALRRHDAELARDLMVEHMRAQGERLIQILKDRGFWSAQEEESS
jgi:DNA-binding GntR family transcriptional regulator